MIAAQAAGPARVGQRRVLLILGGLFLGMFLAALDQTIVATALSTIAGDLHDLSHLSWVVTAYLLASTASTPLWGKLGDQYGRKVFFQASIVIFLIGSALAGLSQSMLELIAFRAIQGLGAGGLIVGAQSIIGDVVAPRDRGRYQGLFGAVFGVTSVIGPLLGGFLVDRLSWQWVFYVNLPVGVVALLVTSAVLPGALRRTHHVIDYAGTVLLAGAATSLVLLTTLGGTTYAWNSPPIYGLGVAGVVLLVLFILVERRAAEPVLPLRLFSRRVFSSASAVGFVVGFSMFGAITYLPQYMQVVQGVGPTESGLRLLPLVAGLLITSIGSGQLISRWGRYRIFPIFGTAVMTVGMFLLSRLWVTTSTLESSVYMFVLGVGIGAVMQVLVIAVQNDADYRDLGAATSGATFFRSIGGSFGTAVFGAIFANTLTGNVAHYLAGVHLPAGFSPTAGASPTVLAALPPAVHTGFVEAYAASIQTVFLVAVPIAAVGFVLSWLLREVPLRGAPAMPDQAQALAPSAMPSARGSSAVAMQALSALGRLEHRSVYRELSAAAGLDLEPRSTWLLLRLDGHPEVHLTALAARLQVPAGELAQLFDPLAERGLATFRPEPGGAGPSGWLVSITPQGSAAIARLVAARRARLEQHLGGWSDARDAELAGEVTRLAIDLVRDPSWRRALLTPAGSRH